MLANLIFMPSEKRSEQRYHTVSRGSATPSLLTFLSRDSGRAGHISGQKQARCTTRKAMLPVQSRRSGISRSGSRSNRNWHDPVPNCRSPPRSSRVSCPKHCRGSGGFDIAARSVMAKEVGGDFFDVIPFEVIPLEMGTVWRSYCRRFRERGSRSTFHGPLEDRCQGQCTLAP